MVRRGISGESRRLEATVDVGDGETRTVDIGMDEEMVEVRTDDGHACNLHWSLISLDITRPCFVQPCGG